MRPPIRRTFLTGAGISAMVGIGLTGVGLLTSSRWQISALVGLVSVLIGVLVSALYAFEQRLGEIDERQIAIRPLQYLCMIPHLESPLVRIVDAVASTQGKRSDFLANRTTAEVERFSELVMNMANGAFVCSSRNEELDLVKGALADTNHEVRAIAARGIGWWQKPDADVYFQAYGEETRRISITRIFLVEKSDFDGLRPILMEHARAGIRTYALNLNHVPEQHRRGLVLFDDALLHRAAPLREGSNDPSDVEFTDVPREIRRAEHDFAVLFKLANRYSAATLFPGKPKGVRSKVRSLLKGAGQSN